MFVSTGPLPSWDTLLFINPTGEVSVFKDGFVSNEGLAFARGSYGEGMFIGELQNGRILRLLPDGTVSVFSSGFTQPPEGLGPAQFTYGPDPEGILDEVLYASDFSSGNILRVNPDGTTKVFASTVARQKAIAHAPGFCGGDFVASNFNFDGDPNTGSIFSISADGQTVTQQITGLEGLQFMTLSPGGAFGDYVYVAAEDDIQQPEEMNDGLVYTLSKSCELKPFMTQIDANNVVFDTQGVLGGGMFVSGADQFGVPEKQNIIWRVVPVPEYTSSLSLLALGTLGAASTFKRKLKPSKSTEKETTKVD